MNPMKFLRQAGVLTLASFIYVSSAAAQDEVAALDSEDGIEAASDTKPLEVTPQHLAVLSRRLADAEALGDLDASIAAINKLIRDLKEERQRWQVERERIANTLAAVRREIEDVKDDIDDTEDAILVSQAVSFGIPDPGLVAIRNGLVAKKNGLKAKREGLKKDLKAADQMIAMIEEQLKNAERGLAAKQAEKRDLQEQIAKVSLIAPSEGARLLVDSSEELRISSDKPPKQVRIEVQKMVVRGGTSVNDPVDRSWETIYDRTLEWKNLGSGPGAVSLAFKTGVRPKRRSIPIVGLEAFWLDRGEYRARVERLGESEHNKGGEGAANDQKQEDYKEEGKEDYKEEGKDDDPPYTAIPPATPPEWRRFSVVGRLDSEAFEKRAPVQAGGPKIKYGSKQVKPGAVLRPTGAKDEDEEDDSE